MILNPNVFISFRPRMMSIAYRMLGSIVEAEDVVQEAFLRFQTADRIVSPEGFLVRVTTRLCIDRLREAKRDQYIGPWVPEPVETKDRLLNSAMAESLTQAFLLMLERLSPDERAAFLLRTVFDYEYAEIASIIEKSETHVRQIVSRARQRLGHGEARFHSTENVASEFAERFVAACRAGDLRQVEAMLAEDVTVHSDGGGKATAARVIIAGRDRAARFLTGVFHKRRQNCEMRMTQVNGEPGVVFLFDGVVVLVTSLWIDNGVQSVYMQLNPDKLSRWSLTEVE